MGCDFLGNQQPVSMRSAGVWQRWKTRIAPFLCFAVVLVLLFAMYGEGDPASRERGEGAAEDHVESSLRGESNESNERMQHVVNSIAGAESGEVEQSSLDTFLDDLARLSRSEDGAEGVVAVVWTERDALPVAAERVLDSYRDAGGVKLVSAGYVDMKGRVWAALLQGEGAWVDVVAVSTDDDAVSEVRIARLIGEGDMG